MNILEFKLMIIRLFNVEEFKESQNIQITDDLVQFYETKFQTEYSGQASITNSKMLNTLSQINNFQRHQIGILRDQFNQLTSGRPRRLSMKPDQSTLEVPECINKSDFEKLLVQAMTDQKGFPQNLDFGQIYDSFDMDQKGAVDFE